MTNWSIYKFVNLKRLLNSILRIVFYVHILDLVSNHVTTSSSAKKLVYVPSFVTASSFLDSWGRWFSVAN